MESSGNGKNARRGFFATVETRTRMALMAA